ncbi:hypothetical protein, partial [Odoribacter splanchnicus]|uniref:hypothetical protein n=1 Tax=Odoribacter splanchnicus TaxID=28118 RepID=UPI001CAA7B50
NARANRQRKYKRKFTAIGNRTVRFIFGENGISQIKIGLQFSDNVSRRGSCLETIGALSVVYLFLSLIGGIPHFSKKTLPYVSVKHHWSGVQKKQDDTRQSSNPSSIPRESFYQ